MGGMVKSAERGDPPGMTQGTILKVEYPLSEMLDVRSVSALGSFSLYILEYLQSIMLS